MFLFSIILTTAYTQNVPDVLLYSCENENNCISQLEYTSKYPAGSCLSFPDVESLPLTNLTMLINGQPDPTSSFNLVAFDGSDCTGASVVLSNNQTFPPGFLTATFYLVGSSNDPTSSPEQLAVSEKSPLPVPDVLFHYQSAVSSNDTVIAPSSSYPLNECLGTSYSNFIPYFVQLMINNQPLDSTNIPKYVIKLYDQEHCEGTGKIAYSGDYLHNLVVSFMVTSIIVPDIRFHVTDLQTEQITTNVAKSSSNTLYSCLGFEHPMLARNADILDPSGNVLPSSESNKYSIYLYDQPECRGYNLSLSDLNKTQSSFIVSSFYVGI